MGGAGIACQGLSWPRKTGVGDAGKECGAAAAILGIRSPFGRVTRQEGILGTIQVDSEQRTASGSPYNSTVRRGCG
jgi:hypothetical protein